MESGSSSSGSSSSSSPNLLVHSPQGGLAEQHVHRLLDAMYPPTAQSSRADYVLMADCAFGKGIQFVRDELVFFAKKAIPITAKLIKSIVLWNADKLTVDAQSALRRCIEVYSHSTRFFLVVENKYKLLKPILSRLCEIYVPGSSTHQSNLGVAQVHPSCARLAQTMERELGLKAEQPTGELGPLVELLDVGDADAIVDAGYSGLDVMEAVNQCRIKHEKRIQWLLAFHQIRRDVRSERVLVWMMLESIANGAVPDYNALVCD